MTLSVIGILVSLAAIVILALRGVGIMLIAPLAVVIVSLFSGMGVLDTLMGPYMKGFINYAGKFYLVFLFASVFGKYMDDSGAAKSIARSILGVIGHEKPLYVLLAVAVITLCLTLGGVSLFVVIFAVMPIARPLFKQLNIPWHLFIAAFIFGIGSISMTMMPGTPSILNIMPMKYLGTTAAAAPLLGIVASIFVACFNVWYMNSQLKKCAARGEGYDVDETKLSASSAGVDEEKELPSFIISIIPSIVVIVALNAFKIDIVYSLVIGCATAALLFFKYVKNHLTTLNAGAFNTAIPVINTCADVGYGMAVAASAGFKVITDFLMSIPGHPVVSLSLATFLMTGITGSASGGLGIVLETLVKQYVAMGVNPEFIHRAVAIAAGAFDALPHNGVIITTLAVAGLTHKQAYRHVWWGHCIAAFLSMFIVIALGMLLY
ncbi:MAG: GntP family permease [Firmicutes bacterium]|nr:GntP family permease [Bacillota bacterium]